MHRAAHKGESFLGSNCKRSQGAKEANNNLKTNKNRNAIIDVYLTYCCFSKKNDLLKNLWLS